MRKRPVQAITYDHFRRFGPHGPDHGRIPPSSHHETPLDRLFTGLAHITGLSRYARQQIVRRIERMERAASDLNVAARIQHLHNQLNTVVDGGWLGLWTSIRVSVGVA